MDRLTINTQDSLSPAGKTAPDAFETVATTPTPVYQNKQSLLHDNNNNNNNNNNTATTTPTNQYSTTKKMERVARQKYSDAGITPTKLLPVEDALDRMEKDRILEESDFVDATPFILRCILFLYGRGFYWYGDDRKAKNRDAKHRDTRLSHIKEFVREPACLQRLGRLAFSSESDKILLGDDYQRGYANLQITADLLFGRANEGGLGFLGGFDGNAIYRIQQSKNCFMICATVWHALKLRWDKVGGENVADISYVGRHFSITNDQQMIERVKNNTGLSSLELAKKLTKRDNHGEDWDLPVCKNFATRPKQLGEVLLGHYESFGPGIVTCKSYPALKRSLKPWRGVDEPGYWLVHGETTHSNAEFLSFESLDRSGHFEKVRYDVRRVWLADKEKAKQAQQELDLQMKAIFPDHQDSSDDAATVLPQIHADNDDGADSSVTNNEPGSHAFALIGGIQRPGPDGATGIVELVLLNWWKTSPLIVVPAAYLAAIEAKVHFLTAPLDRTQPLPLNPHLVAETDYPDPENVLPSPAPIVEIETE